MCQVFVSSVTRVWNPDSVGAEVLRYGVQSFVFCDVNVKNGHETRSVQLAGSLCPVRKLGNQVRVHSPSREQEKRKAKKGYKAALGYWYYSLRCEQLFMQVWW